MCSYDGVQRGNYFGGEPIRKIEVEEKVKKLKNEKAAGKDEVTLRVMLCQIVPLYKGK